MAVASNPVDEVGRSTASGDVERAVACPGSSDADRECPAPSIASSGGREVRIPIDRRGAGRQWTSIAPARSPTGRAEGVRGSEVPLTRRPCRFYDLV